MQTEIIGFIVIVNIVLLILIGGIVFFTIQYRRRKRKYDKDKQMLDEQHQLDLLSLKIETQQQTMQHIGVEIHDSVGQKLTLASLYSKQFKGLSPGDQETRIQQISAIVDESLAELRQLSKSLTNPALANSSLIELLQEEAKRVNLSGVCYVNVIDASPGLLLPQSDKNIIFRIIQEFIQNSLKHANCRKISITIERESCMLKVTAFDDGKGFDRSMASTGIGLHNMQRRAEQLNSVYKLESALGIGTTMILQINLQK